MEVNTARQPLMLESSVSLVFSPSKTRYYVLVKSSLRRHVQIIKVDPISGALKFTCTYGKDMFPTEAQAMDFLRHEGPLEVLSTGKHVLGYVVIGPTGLLLLAEKVRVSATLPGNHQVKTLVTSKWHKIPLQSSPNPINSIGMPPPDPEALVPASQREEYQRGVEKVTTFPLDGAHFFCETIDLSRPFPSDRPVTQPSWEFVWNRWLTASFRGIGLDFVCPPLLQGLCEERGLNDFDGSPYTVVLISRRNRLHVGPRYKARGINEYAEPANEIEVEQVIWRKPAKEGLPIPWSRYTWRRGSVPLWWGVHMRNNGLGEAEIKIKEHRTFKGTKRYVRRLQKRYMPSPRLDPEDGDDDVSHTNGAGPSSGSIMNGPHSESSTPRSTTETGGGGGLPRSSTGLSQAHWDPSLRVRLMFVSLLRKGTPDRDRSEAKLASAFDFVANALRKEHNIPLEYIAIDWHEMDKQLGSHGIVEAFWQSIKDILPKHGYAFGTMAKVEQDAYDLAKAGVEPPSVWPSTNLPRCVSCAGLGWQARWFRQQRGIARYNCADSLDRTNVGSFFGAVQVFVEQCRELDIAIAVSTKNAMTTNIAALMRKQQLAGTPGALPSQRSLATVSMGQHLGPGNAGGKPAMGDKFDKLGKEFNKMIQEMKSPKNKDGGFRVETSASSATDLGSLRRPSMGSLFGTSTMPRVPTAQQPHPHHPSHLLHSSSVGPNHLPPAPSGTPPAPVQALMEQGHQHSSSEAQIVAAAVVGVGTTSAPNLVGLSAAQQPSASQVGIPPPSQAQQPSSPFTDLPPGWEAKIERTTQRVFYVDHNTKTTHWERPATPPASLPAPGTSSVGNGAPATPPTTSPSPTPSPASHALTVTPPAATPAPALPNGGIVPPTPSAMLPPTPGGRHGALVAHQGAGALVAGRPTADSILDIHPTDRARLAEEERELWEPLSPWCMLKSKVKTFARRINPDALSALAELFLVNGDMSAWLYTGSQAMHSERILLFEPETSKLRKAGVGMYGNIMVGIKRRYNNVLVDTDKQQQIEMFLGMKHSVYFPAVKLYYKEDGSVPLDFPEEDDESDPISMIDWVTDKGGDKSVYGGNSSGSGTPGAEAGANHNRMRGKSYTTAELLDTFKASQATQSMFAAASKFSQMLPAAAQALGVVTATGGPNGSTTVTVAATNMGPTGLGANGGDSEERGSMHKAVSDNSMLYLAGADVNDKDSDVSSQASMSLGHAMSAASMPRSVSVGEGLNTGQHSASTVYLGPVGSSNSVGMGPVYTSSQDQHPLAHMSSGQLSNAALPTPTAQAYPGPAWLQPQSQQQQQQGPVDPLGHPHHAHHHSAGAAGGAPPAGFHARHASTTSISSLGSAGSGSATPDRLVVVGGGPGLPPTAPPAGFLRGASTQASGLGSALKSGFKKLADPFSNGLGL